MRIRKIRNYGGQLVIALRDMDHRELGFEAGDEVDIEDIQKVKTKKKRSK